MIRTGNKPINEASAQKEFTILVRRKGKTREVTGTLDYLVNNYFGYTLEVGASYQNEKGNHKIDRKPKTAAALVKNLNWAKSNASANGYSDTIYELKESSEMIRVGNKPTNEAADNYDVVIDYSKARVVNKTPYAIFPQIAIPLVINGRENYDDISISLWGGSKFSYDVKYNHIGHGGMLPHDFGDKHASIMNLEKITRDEFTKAYKNKAPNHSEIDSFLQSQVSKVWKGSSISAKGKISQALYNELVDKMASYFKMK